MRLSRIGAGVRGFWVLTLIFLIAGCAAMPRNGATYRAASAPEVAPTAVVFVANGAGDTRVVSQNLQQLVTSARLPLQIEAVDWSQGTVLADQTDSQNHLVHGRRLAAQVNAYRQAYPNRRIYLLGHSAGSAVVLHATEALPANTVDRVVLLSSSVCSSYDLRPALRASREGIDSFHSAQDRIVLGGGVGLVGTTEGGCRTAAGQFGFTPVIASPADAALYARLNQHAWKPSMQYVGHFGGHFGVREPEFLRTYILPLFEPEPGMVMSGH